LQVLVTDPVMGAVQPRFQVCEDEMDDWQILLGDLRIAALGDGEVFVAALGEPGVAAPVVGDERRARHNGTLDEAAERLRASVRHDGEPNTPGIATTLPLVELGTRLALTNLHSTDDKNLIVDATAFAARPATDPGFIDFNVLAGPAADPVLILGAPSPRGACGGFETPSRSATDQVVAEAARPTCRVSGWTPDRQTKTIRSAACASVP